MSAHLRSCLAFSGGETSALAALLLLHEGDHLSACHFYIDPKGRFPLPPGFSTADDRNQMAKYASQHEIPLEFIDVTAEFEDRVMDATIHARISAARDQSYALWTTKVFVPEWVRFAEAKKCSQLVSGHRALLSKQHGQNAGLIERIPNADRDDSGILLALPPEWRSRVRLPVAELPELMIRKFKEEARLPEISNHVSVLRGSLYPPEAWTNAGWILNYVSQEFLQPGTFQSLRQFIDRQHSGIYALQVGDVVPDEGSEEGEQYILKLNPVSRGAIVGPREFLDQTRFFCSDARFEVELDPLLPITTLEVAKFDDPSFSVECRLTPYAHGFYDLETREALPSIEEGQFLVFYSKNTPIGSATVERVIHTAQAEFEKLQSR